MQQAREMVLEIIREKDQADFRGVRGDFGSRMGGGSIEVCLSHRLVGKFKVVGHASISSLTLSKLFNSFLTCKTLRVHSLPRVGVRKEWGRQL